MKALRISVAIAAIAAIGQVAAPGTASAHHPVIDTEVSRACGADQEWSGSFTTRSDAVRGKNWRNRYKIDGGAFSVWSPWVDDATVFGPVGVGPIGADVASVEVQVYSQWQNKAGTSNITSGGRTATLVRPAASDCDGGQPAEPAMTPGSCTSSGSVQGVDTDSYTWVYDGPESARTAQAVARPGYALQSPTSFGPYDLTALNPSSATCDPCPYDDTIPAGSEYCEPCAYDETIPALSDDCNPCSYDDTIPALSDDCNPCSYDDTIDGDSEYCDPCSYDDSIPAVSDDCNPPASTTTTTTTVPQETTTTTTVPQETTTTTTVAQASPTTTTTTTTVPAPTTTPSTSIASQLPAAPVPTTAPQAQSPQPATPVQAVTLPKTGPDATTSMSIVALTLLAAGAALTAAGRKPGSAQH